MNSKIKNGGVWTIAGVLLMAFLVVATTTITDSEFNSGGGNIINVANISGQTNINVTFLGDVNFKENAHFTQNITLMQILFLDSGYQLSPGQSKILRRNNANGAVFGLANNVAGANTMSGVSYIWENDVGNYTIDLHSSLDTNNPNQVIHHLNSPLTAEKWRISNGVFEFENGLDSMVMRINSTSTQITIQNLSGSGTGFVCVDANGIIFRKATACA